uniref:CSON005512 protein n=1 Tax=Culicoides sonorensis TaxID=179676 RepID=A0A336MUR7_CULSO
MSETSPKVFKPRKVYRKLLKKMQRKRRRQKLAILRSKEEEELENDPLYQAQKREQLALELARQELEEEMHRIQEEKWLENERNAQLKFAEERARIQLLQNSYKEKEKQEILLREKLKKQKEDRIARENLAFESYLEQIELYISGVRENIPDLLNNSIESKPGRDICGFYAKTSVCRFMDSCAKNHIKPGISKILLLRHFFNHIRLEQSKNTEYGEDLQYEYEDGELQKAYEEFYYDAVYEIEKFGTIENFVCSKQSSAHHRGNVYVEFKNQRDALRAYQGLIGRFYAGKQISIEFSGMNNFVQALCGKSFRNICTQGANCNFIHMFKNPGSKHRIDAFWLQMQWELLKKKQKISERSLLNTSSREKPNDWDIQVNDREVDKRHWRWSESPENDRKAKNSNSKKPKVVDLEVKNKVQHSTKEKDEKKKKTDRHHKSSHKHKDKKSRYK